MLFALFAFIGLLIAGVVMEELGWKMILSSLVFVFGALAAFIVFHWSLFFYTVVLALVDIVLVLRIFKGDINIPM